jgi:hypothetical protein
MKKLSVLLILGIAMVFFGCQKESPDEPGLDEPSTPALKAEKVYFEGVCQNPVIIYCGDVQELPNGIVKVFNFESEWDDNTNDPLTTGKSHWVENFWFSKDKKNSKAWGKSTLTVEGGEWEISFKGYSVAKESFELGPPCPGPPVPFETTGGHCNAVGKSGVVKGMVGEWNYYMDWNGVPQPFEYEIWGWYKYPNN